MSQPTCKTHSICEECIAWQTEKYPDVDFKVKCSGICEIDEIVPEEVRIMYTDEQLRLAESVYNPVTWAADQFDWEPRVAREEYGGARYQEMMLRCTARRKALRLGRQSGKTEAICILMLFKAFTNNNFKVLVITPYRSQIELIFKRVKELMWESADLSNSIKREVANPYHEIEFFNGSYIRGFTSGSKTSSGAGAVRGQPADMIVLDEADYLTTQDINAVVAILNSRPECELYASSTPTGRRDHFHRWCQLAPNFREFHFPSYVIPHWNDELEEELRLTLTEAGYTHEILAEFGEEEEGVFQVAYREAAEEEYSYHDINPDPSKYITGIGVDWNSSNIGTEIYVMIWDRKTGRFLGARAETISRVGFTQVKAIEKIQELNRQWDPAFIYVDEGYGATQVEVMKVWSQEQMMAKGPEHSDAKLGVRLRAINFSAKIELPDPITRQMIKKDTKSYMVENAVRMFERGIFIFPKSDQILKDQLGGYVIQRRTQLGKPVFGAREERIGDHRLDAMMLAFLGFHLEYSDLVRMKFTQTIGFAKGLRAPRAQGPEPGDTVVVDPEEKKRNSPRRRLMPEGTRDEFVTEVGLASNIRRAGGKKGPPGPLWSWPGFLKDGPLPTKKKPTAYQRKNRPSRSKF